MGRAAKKSSEFLPYVAPRIRPLCAFDGHAQNGPGMGRAARTPDKFVVCLATHVQRLVRLKLPIIGDSNDGSFSHRRLLGQTTAVSQPFFEARTIDLSRRLLGCVLTHRGTAGMIVETEAYLGEDDLAAHSSRGETQRTKVIFGPPGRAYVYFIYGMHECLNIVAEPAGKPGCVLIRALQPLTDIELMRQRRQWKGNITGLTNGPGKLTQALDITRAQYGARLDRGGLTIRHWRKQPQFAIETTPRIGIRECADWPLRFVWAGHPCLSRN